MAQLSYLSQGAAPGPTVTGAPLPNRLRACKIAKPFICNRCVRHLQQDRLGSIAPHRARRDRDRLTPTTGPGEDRRFRIGPLRRQRLRCGCRFTVISSAAKFLTVEDRQPSDSAAFRRTACEMPGISDAAAGNARFIFSIGQASPRASLGRSVSASPFRARLPNYRVFTIRPAPVPLRLLFGRIYHLSAVPDPPISLLFRCCSIVPKNRVLAASH
jgi:hypothetical protein